MKKSISLLLFAFLFVPFVGLAVPPPPPAWVNDGPGADIDLTTQNSSYSANWAATDWSGTPNNYDIRYQYWLQEQVGAVWNDVDSGDITTVYPSTPSTSLSKAFSLNDGTYRMRIRSGREAAVGGWEDSADTYSDGFLVDTTPPTASIDPLSSQQTSTTFQVSWSGSDSGSGIASYDVQVKEGNASWSTLVSNTTATSTIFQGNNGQTYLFRVRATDVAGNVGGYSGEAQTVVAATGVSMSISASPSSLVFYDGETSKNVELSITATGPGGVDLYQIGEERYNPETGTETLPPELIGGTIPSGSTYKLVRMVTLSSLQRSIMLATSSQSFTLTFTIEGQDSFSNPVIGGLNIPVQVSLLPPQTFNITGLTIDLPPSPYYVGDVVQNVRVTIDAVGSGSVQGQVYVDDSTGWSQNPNFSLPVNGNTSFYIQDELPTTAAGDHTVKVEITDPVVMETQDTYTVSDQTPPFPPQTLVIVPDVAELSDLNGTAQATTVTGPNGYVEYDFTGTAKMTLLSLNSTEVNDVTVANLIVRYDNSNPTKAKIRGGTVEKEVQQGYITDFADGSLRIKRISFTGQVSPATDFLTADAKLYWKKIDMELFPIEGFIVKTEGVEGKSVNINESSPKSFNAFGLDFNTHDVDAKPALVFGKDEANSRYYFGISGSLSMKEKKGTSTTNKKLTTFEGFTIYSDGEVTGTITISKKFDIVPGHVTLTEIQFQHENQKIKMKLKGNIHDLPSPLDKLPKTEFAFKFDKDGNAEGTVTPIKELKKNNQGHGLGANDSTEWDVGVGNLDITYLSLFLQFDEGELNKDHSEIQVGLDIYLNLKNQDGSKPSDNEKRISFGELNANSDFTGGVRINLDGDFTWNSPTNATIIQNKRLDLAVAMIAIDALGIDPDPFAIVFTGSIVLDFESVEGGVSFENLKIGLDGVISNLSNSITGGQLSVMEVVQVEVDDVNWSTEEADLTFRENQSQGEGENQVPETGQKTIRVDSYLQLLGASMSVGDGEGATVLSGGFAEFTVYKPVNGSTSFVLKEAELSVSEIELYADVEYSEALLKLAGGLTMPGPEGPIDAVAVGKMGIQQGKTTMGIFIAAAGLRIPVGPAVFLNEVGGGFFLNPIEDDLRLVRRIADFERPELNESIEEMRPGGADNPGSYALMLLGGFYVTAQDVLYGRALATLTSNFFNLDAEVEFAGGLLEGTAYLAIGWNPSYAEGAVDIAMDFARILEGEGNLDFYVYGSDAWGVMGAFNVKLLGMDLASGSVFAGNPGFMLETTVRAGVDMWLISGSYSITGMFWYYRTPDPDTFGAYGKVTAQGEFLKGLLGAKASLEGALMAVPSFVFYSVGSVKFKVCYITVFKGSLWISVSSSGFDGGKGRNSHYDGLIEEARNMADDLKSSRDELLDELEQAKLELAKLTPEQLEAAGIELVERSGILGGLVELIFQYEEMEKWGNSLPAELEVIRDLLFGEAQEDLTQTRTDLASLNNRIEAAFPDLEALQQTVGGKLSDYEELIIGDLPSVQEIGAMKDPFRGMSTQTVVNSNGEDVTVAVGFEIDEGEAESQRDQLYSIREDFAEYQDEFIKQAGVIDGSLQMLDEILFMNEENLSELTESYTHVYNMMGEYVDSFVEFQGQNYLYAEDALATMNASLNVGTIETIMENKANSLSENALNSWNNDRNDLINTLVQIGGLQASPPQNIGNAVELFKLKGVELWWTIPRVGFVASVGLAPERRTDAISSFNGTARDFRNKWNAATQTADTIYERKAQLYTILYEIYDQLAYYGSGLIGVTGEGDAAGFGGVAGTGLSFRTSSAAQTIPSKGKQLPADTIKPDTPTIGPLRPAVNPGTTKRGGPIGFNDSERSYQDEMRTQMVKQIGMTFSNTHSILVAEAGIADFTVAGASPKAKRANTFQAEPQAPAQTEGRSNTVSEKTYAKEGVKVGKFKNIIDRLMGEETQPSEPESWVPIQEYFSAKRDEISPYLEIPVVSDFTGSVLSKTEFNALLTADFSAEHPIGVVEYSYRIEPAPFESQSTSMRMRKELFLAYSVLTFQEYPSKLYAGGVPDTGEEYQAEGYQFMPQALELVLIERPWFSLGATQEIKEPFFPDIHMEGDYNLFLKVRGAGGYTIVRRAQLNLRYFDPDTDSAPVISQINTSDATAPTKPVVTLLGAYTSSEKQLFAEWYSSDPESGIQKYEYGVSTAAINEGPDPGAQKGIGEEPGVKTALETESQESFRIEPEQEPDVLPWQNAGGRVEANIRGLALEHNTSYVVEVRATNGEGRSARGASEPVIVDLTPPSLPAINSFTQVAMGDYPNSVSFSFVPGEDSESGIISHWIALGTTEGSDNLLEWTEINRTDGSVVNLPLSEGSAVYLTVETYNGAGLKSEVSQSLEMHYSDTSPPEMLAVVMLPQGFTSDASSVEIGWDEMIDRESGIVKYEYGIGTTEGNPDVVSWTNVNLEEKPFLLGSEDILESTGNENKQKPSDKQKDKTGGKGGGIDEAYSSSVFDIGVVKSGLNTDYIVEKTGLSLQNGNTYYCLVRITNGAGLLSIGASQPLTVDTTPPEEASLSGPERIFSDEYLPVALSARDSDSGIEYYRYAVWDMEYSSMDLNRDEKRLVLAGIADCPEIFVIAGSSPAVEETQPEASMPGDAYEQFIQSGGEGNYTSPQQELPPWATEEVPMLEPWTESGWKKVSSGSPPEEIDLDLHIANFPSPGLESGKLYTVQVWVKNGAGVATSAGKVTIIVATVRRQKHQKVPQGVKQGGK